ncbi:MAG: methyltransferase domain-containing protein [Acidobacteria bacterium]|nr:methyltransferase domain-containing protein [Acidobacteriota bacterium]
MDFNNVYDDELRALAYAGLEFPGTYYLAFRDLPAIFARHVTGRRALDFGCGAGRSTRFLQNLGFETSGVDIAAEMIRQARKMDPGGDYHLVADSTAGPFDQPVFDLILAAFTFDNIPTREKKRVLFRTLGRCLKSGGVIVNLVSAPEIYVHEWASFSTRDFPGNRTAVSGQKVRIVMKDVPDQRPVEDILCADEEYRAIYAASNLELVTTYRPLADGSEPFIWIHETRVPPWVIYILRHLTTG